MAEASGRSGPQSTNVSPINLSVEEEGERWLLKKYERVVNASDKDKNPPHKWEYESNKESDLITITILTTGHFLISQGYTLLEGFSLNPAKSWLKIGKKLDWLLFGSKMKDDFRMFRVQFDGDSKDKAQENCTRCFQRLQDFLCDQNESGKGSSQSFPEQRITVAQMVEGMMGSKQTNSIDTTNLCPPSSEELCSFLKLCLLDQNFPEFVEAVENELYKLLKN